LKIYLNVFIYPLYYTIDKNEWLGGWRIVRRGKWRLAAPQAGKACAVRHGYGCAQDSRGRPVMGARYAPQGIPEDALSV
jgi:hypothetical protein